MELVRKLTGIYWVEAQTLTITMKSLGVIVMTFWYIFGTDLTFFKLFKPYFHLGLITTPHVLYVHMTYVYSFLIFHSSHNHMAKRSHYRIMIFSTLEYYSMDAFPPSFSSISSTIPPPLYSPLMSVNDGPTWRRTLSGPLCHLVRSLQTERYSTENTL